MKILIELPTWLGDAIMTTPAIENLIEQFNDAEIILIGSIISIEALKNHPKVTVTIDTFQWGIVFFRAEQQKEHFVINPNKTISSHLFERIRF